MNVLLNKHDVDVLADLGLPSRGSAILNVHHTLFWRGAIRNPDRELLTPTPNPSGSVVVRFPIQYFQNGELVPVEAQVDFCTCMHHGSTNGRDVN